MTFYISQQPTNGYATITNPATGTFTYTPNNGFIGTDTFTFYVSDGTYDSGYTLETITVLPTSGVPVASNGALATQGNTPITGVLSAVDSDGDALTFQVVLQPLHGTVTITNTSTGAFTYMPAAGFNGQDTFTFNASDGQSTSNMATETIVVNALLHVNGNMYFIYDEGGRLLGTYDKNGNVRQEYITLGDRPVGVTNIGGLNYVHVDQLNTPRAITNQNQQLIWQWNSDPFGNGVPNEEPSNTSVKYIYNNRFPGQYYDSETGDNYNIFRDTSDAL